MSMVQSPKDAPLFLGIEGGGTRLVAICTDLHERSVRQFETGPANLRLLSDNELLERFLAVSSKMPVPAAIGLGLAGLRTEQDRARVLAAAAQVWPGIPCHACSDLETALAAAGDAPGQPALTQVLVLSGTGSCCYGRTALGQTAKIGGWGHVLGDKGSAYEIGLRALKAVVYYSDRDGRWPELGSALLRALQLNQPDDLIAWVGTAEKREVAALALEVFSAWTRGDKIATDILKGAAHSLAKDAAACAARLVRAGEPVQFVLAGSVLIKQPRFARFVSKQLGQVWPAAEIISLTGESAMGAVRLAKAQWSRRGDGSSTQTGIVRSTTATPAIQRQVRSSRSVAGASFVHEICLPKATGLSPTESRNPLSTRLHKLPLDQAVSLMLTEEAKVPAALLAKKQQITRCVQWVVRTFQQGGRLFYVGAGTSGRLGALDASECPPTFRVSADQVQGIMAGGQQALWQSIEGAEDDAQAGAEAVIYRGVRAADVVVGIAASGRTPFVWGALAQAKEAGARTILICFNPHWKIERACRPDLVLAVDLGPEVLTGSTRLKAGTATKLVLNVLTTLSMVRLGKVISNLMVDLNPSNQKLRERAVRIVRDLTGVDQGRAQEALEKSDWVVKAALAQCGRSKARG